LVGYWQLKACNQRITLLITQRATWVKLGLVLAVLTASTISLGMGSVQLSSTEVWLALLGEGSAMLQLVVKKLRLMRVLAGIGTGAVFAFVGCLLQIFDRNIHDTFSIICI